MVNQLQAERDAFAERLQEQEGRVEPLEKKPRMREDFVVNTVEGFRSPATISTRKSQKWRSHTTLGPSGGGVNTRVDPRQVRAR